MNQFKIRKLIRLKDYDYSKYGYYYITICTKNRENHFGIIKNEHVILNQFGDIAYGSWQDIPNHHKNVNLDRFIIMPNHIHGILILCNTVGNGPARSNHKNGKIDNLSVIIGSYKSAVSKQINKIKDNSFKWQKSFYDHIIRTDESLNNIREYIINNPTNWDNDENNFKHSIAVQAGLNPTDNF